MSLNVTIVDADHRASVFAEIELEGELVAEAYVEGETMRVAFTDSAGKELWHTSAEDLLDGLRRARTALAEMGLIDQSG